MSYTGKNTYSAGKTIGVLMGGASRAKKSQFKFGNFGNPGGGLNFSKTSELEIALRHYQK